MSKKKEEDGFGGIKKSFEALALDKSEEESTNDDEMKVIAK
jgi:hypothetical protein